MSDMKSHTNARKLEAWTNLYLYGSPVAPDIEEPPAEERHPAVRYLRP